jgi:hypothetical protein
MFGLGYAFAHQIESGIREVQQWVVLIAAAGIGGWLLYRYYAARKRAGRGVGPPVIDSDEVPIPAALAHPEIRSDETATHSEPLIDAPSRGLGSPSPFIMPEPGNASSRPEGIGSAPLSVDDPIDQPPGSPPVESSSR